MTPTQGLGLALALCAFSASVAYEMGRRATAKECHETYKELSEMIKQLEKKSEVLFQEVNALRARSDERI